MAAVLSATSSSIVQWQEQQVAPTLTKSLRTRLTDKGALGEHPAYQFPSEILVAAS